MAADVGKRVAYYRERFSNGGRKMTAQALADRCADLGLPIGRVAIAKLENGMREKVSLAEILILAAALEVAPMQLVFPFGIKEGAEILPGFYATNDAAAYWFLGYLRLNRRNAENPDAVGESDFTPSPDDDVIPLYDEHSRLLTMLDPHANELAKDMTEAELLRQRDVNSASLRRVREIMRERGLYLPELPPALAHIDAPPEVSRPKAPGRPWSNKTRPGGMSEAN